MPVSQTVVTLLIIVSLVSVISAISGALPVEISLAISSGLSPVSDISSSFFIISTDDT